MSTTYSINVGTITESLRKENIYQALLDLPDNVQKKISPKLMNIKTQISHH